MKPEEINVAIAEACGWKRGVTFESSFVSPSKDIARDCWYGPDGKIPQRKIPNYYGDLNAIHEAESQLTGAQCLEFEKHLNAVTGYFKHITHFVLIHATAPQRCEAFLKALGKWVETKGED